MLRAPRKWLLVTIITLIVSAGVVLVRPPALGIDFTGGSLIELTTTGSVHDVRALIDQQSLSASVQLTESGSLIVRTTSLSEEEHQAFLTQLRDAELLGEELRFESIGPTIGAELRRKALVAVVSAVVAMVLYLAYTFRQASGLISSWKFGIAAAVALLHDVLLVTAVFALLQSVGARIDTLFVTAMLAILGYSVNDTIVLFNRFKEEWLTTRQGDLITVMDQAARKTLARSLNTSFTTLLVLVALLVLGGETLRWFVVALALGTIAGTYSSLFVAPPVLHFLAKRS